MEKLRGNLSLIPSAVEEMLRFESPSQHTARLAPDDCELGGKQIRKRQAVIAVMAAANRDPGALPRSRSLRYRARRQSSPRVRLCCAFLFRRAAGAAGRPDHFRVLIAPLPDSFHLEPQELVWRTNLGLRGLTSLKIGFEQPRVRRQNPPLADAQPGGSRVRKRRSRVARGAKRSPSSTIGARRLQISRERHRLLVEWNDTAKPYPADRCVHELIEARAAEIAAWRLRSKIGSQRITYANLNRRANQLARILLSQKRRRTGSPGCDLPEALAGIADRAARRA